MKIFLKYIIKSMLEKKSRFLLLLIAISISTGFLVTSIGVVDIAISSFTKPMLELYENKELQITSKGNDNFFETDNINENGVKNIQKEIYIGGFYNVDDEIKDLGIRGREENLLKSDKIIAGSISDFKGNKCIISKRVSEDLDLEVNDTIKVIIGGQPKELEIAAINSNDTIFYNDTASNFTIIVPYEYLAKDFNAEGKYNSIFADSDEENVQKAIDKFNENNSDFECSKLFDEESIKAQTGNFINTLYLMLVIVVFMSAIIIYGSFKLTITERMPIIGTFLSQGATSKTIEVILYCESILYGIIGAIIGNIIAVFGLKGISRIISPLKEYGIYENPNISLKYFIVGTIFSVFLSLVSSIIPIRRIRKLQVKEVILNNVNTTMSISFKRFIVGVILIVISVVVNFISSELANNISIVFVLISITGLTLAYPKIIDIVTNVLCKFFKGRCNTVFLALNNLRTSKVLLSNITLIIISLLSVLLITSIGTSIKVTLVDCYEKLNYDISIFNISTIREDEVSVEDKIKEILRSNENINFNSVQGITFVTALIDGKTVYLQGIEADKYKNYNEYIELNSNENYSMYNDFTNSKEKEIIITTTDAKLINKKVSDTVTIEAYGLKREYKIAGIIEGKLYNGGLFALIKNTDLKEDFGINSANSILLSTNKDQEEVKEEIKKSISEFGASIVTSNDSKKNDEEANEMLVNILSIFAYMAVIIASLGVLNNITIGFIQRKRDFAVLSSVGMRKSKRNLMLIVESCISVIWSLIFAVSIIKLELSLVTKFLKVINMPLKIELDVYSIPMCFIISLIVILLATLPVIFKSKKLSIIEELKYE